VPRPRTISETLDRVLEDDPGRPALIAPSGMLSYAELDAAANAAAASLQQMGVAPGDRVAASLPNDLDIVTAFHGAMRLGAIWVGVNRNLAAPEKDVLLAAAGPTVFVADPDTAASHTGPWRVVPAGADDPGSEWASEWASALRSSAGASRPPAPDPEAPAAIAFTSGTTGQPKGIVHSQRNLLLPAASLAASRGYDETLRKGDCLPLTILNLQVLTTLLTSAAGGCCILTDRRDARGVAEWLFREKVNLWNGVPALLYSMTHDAEIDPQLLSSLREVWTGGGACPEDLYTAFEARFGVRLRQSYGLTEAPTVVTMEAMDDQHVDGSSGVLLPHLAMAVRDDDGRDLPTGEMGEIVVCGVKEGPWAGTYTPMTGYWRDGSVEPYRSDELPTGDIGAVDGSGNLFVRDRKKLLILRGGANVYPNEVERELERVPGVRGSAVVGVPDERLGQRVVAVIEVEPDFGLVAEDVIDHCRGRLARYKVPEQIRIVDALPRNAMGKVQRAPLTELFLEPG
jgi:acyl-CoA synthetase (AMP-forming)/AMP-acid ligase II